MEREVGPNVAVNLRRSGLVAGDADLSGAQSNPPGKFGESAAESEGVFEQSEPAGAGPDAEVEESVVGLCVWKDGEAGGVPGEIAGEYQAAPGKDCLSVGFQMQDGESVGAEGAPDGAEVVEVADGPGSCGGDAADDVGVESHAEAGDAEQVAVDGDEVDGGGGALLEGAENEVWVGTHVEDVCEEVFVSGGDVVEGDGAAGESGGDFADGSVAAADQCGGSGVVE